MVISVLAGSELELKSFGTWVETNPEMFEPIIYGETVTVTGIGLHGDSAASDGTTRSSAVNYPYTTLRSLENGRTFSMTPSSFLPPEDPGGTATLTFDFLPPGLNVGPHALTITASGIPSEAVIVNVGCADTVITSQPADATVEIGDTTSFTLGASSAARLFQWQRCVTENCLEGDWEDIIDATSPSYTTQQVVPAGLWHQVPRWGPRRVWSQPHTLRSTHHRLRCL